MIGFYFLAVWICLGLYTASSIYPESLADHHVIVPINLCTIVPQNYAKMWGTLPIYTQKPCQVPPFTPLHPPPLPLPPLLLAFFWPSWAFPGVSFGATGLPFCKVTLESARNSKGNLASIATRAGASRCQCLQGRTYHMPCHQKTRPRCTWYSTYKYMLNDCRHRLQYVMHLPLQPRCSQMSLSIILCSRSSLQQRRRVNAGCQTLYRILRLKNPQNIQNDVTTSCPNHARQGRDQGGSVQPASEPAFFFRRSSKESTIFSCWQRTWSQHPPDRMSIDIIPRVSRITILSTNNWEIETKSMSHHWGVTSSAWNSSTVLAGTAYCLGQALLQENLVPLCLKIGDQIYPADI